MRLSVALAGRARDEHRPDGWVAASVGPYGAYLADGSEYRGDYDLDVAGLREFHRARLEVLAGAGADVLARGDRSRAWRRSRLSAPSWTAPGSRPGSASPRDGDRTRAGEPWREAWAMAADVAEIVAVGVNCCDAGRRGHRPRRPPPAPWSPTPTPVRAGTPRAPVDRESAFDPGAVGAVAGRRCPAGGRLLPGRARRHRRGVRAGRRAHLIHDGVRDPGSGPETSQPKRAVRAGPVPMRPIPALTHGAPTSTRSCWRSAPGAPCTRSDARGARSVRWEIRLSRRAPAGSGSSGGSRNPSRRRARGPARCRSRRAATRCSAPCSAPHSSNAAIIAVACLRPRWPGSTCSPWTPSQSPSSAASPDPTDSRLDPTDGASPRAVLLHVHVEVRAREA